MYNDKKCIGIIFDPSYLIYNISTPMAKIFEILTTNKDAHFIYGGIKRLVDHVDEYARNLKIPKERLHLLCLPVCSPNTGFVNSELASKWLLELLAYNPDRLYVFRDNSHMGLTTALVRSCIDRNIPIMEINNRNEYKCIDQYSLGESKGYRTRPGRVYDPKINN